MPPDETSSETHGRWRLVGPIMGVVAIVIAVVALAAWVWCPTTLQPNVIMSDATYVSTPCAPTLGGYANRYDWTFTLRNTGLADGQVAVQFLLNGQSMGYKHFTVPRGSQVEGTGFMFGEVHASQTECGPLDTTAVALASVTRSPPIDERAVLSLIARPVSTLAFVGVLMGALSIVARRRGISLFRDMGSMGWVIAVLIVGAASMAGAAATQALITPYNNPADWTPAVVGGVVALMIAAGGFFVAYRVIARRGSDETPRTG